MAPRRKQAARIQGGCTDESEHVQVQDQREDGLPTDRREIVSDARLRLFVVAGMPRSGTTFLYHNLQKHPALFLPFRKESNYFFVNYARGVEWYRSLYRKITPDQVGGDISPFYFMDQRAIPRIAEFSPDVKVILAVREPAAPACSVIRDMRSYKASPTVKALAAS